MMGVKEEDYTSMRHVHTVALNDEEEKRLKEIRDEGSSLMDVVRAGLDRFREPVKVIKTKEEAVVAVSKLGSNLGGYNEYGCGCVKDGGNLCPKHGRV